MEILTKFECFILIERYFESQRKDWWSLEFFKIRRFDNRDLSNFSMRFRSHRDSRRNETRDYLEPQTGFQKSRNIM